MIFQSKSKLSSLSSMKTWSRSSLTMADAASWYCVFVMLAFLLLSSAKENDPLSIDEEASIINLHQVKGNQLQERPCEEIYVVGEGETLHTISDKCGDPFIVENNPHIHDPDDVFPGLVIKIITKHINRKH
ncbi:hypothetical protein Leryth_013188 [Lithospermum erythrorhizon]|nr:hypothetical protein Leryth_013188 [Lithospermum erythrorhizon]